MKMTLLKRISTVLALVAVSALGLAQDNLGSAKAEGLVGERPDGLVAIVADDPPAEVRELVDEVNAERMNEYRRIAEETDAPLEAVQARAGRQLIDRLPAGQYFMDAAGRWRQK